jgi:cysteine protease ATG4
MKADKEEEQYILMTYRSNIEKKMPTTYYNSDSGWGCMLRVGQMAIANLIHLHEKIPLKILLTLFWDNSDMPFSIQNFTFVTSKEYPNKKPYEWYNPCEMGFIVKKLLEEQFPIYQTKIFLDNSIFLSEIPKDKPKLLLMIMIRIGLEQPEDIYLPVVKSLI